MSVLAVVHRNAPLSTSLRRGLADPYVRVVTCRTRKRVETLLATDVVDSIVVDVLHNPLDWLANIADRFPRIPLFAYSAFRPDDGRLLSACFEVGVRAVLVERVDDPVAGEIVSRFGASRVRKQLVTDAPRLLRLTEAIQLRAWHEALGRVGSLVTTADIAQSLRVSREHLSREFGAGGAPNLKRVIDLARIICAADLLQNPGYSVSTVAAILHFASSSHLASSARRVTGTTPAQLPGLGPRGVLAHFLRGRTRSRL